MVKKYFTKSLLQQHLQSRANIFICIGGNMTTAEVLVKAYGNGF